MAVTIIVIHVSCKNGLQADISTILNMMDGVQIMYVTAQRKRMKLTAIELKLILKF